MKNSFVLSCDKEQRLDKALLENLKDVNRSQIKKSIDDGLVLVNNKVATKSGLKVKNGDKIDFEMLEKKELSATPENIDLDIVYENDNLLVINKPQGLCVHPAVGNYSGTLVNALAYHIKNLSDINGEYRPGIVHRLDKDTSGLLLVAKNNFAHENLANQIKDKSCKRYYIALLEGNLKQDEGTVETFLTRSEKDRKKYEVSTNKGKYAITKYKVLERYQGYSLVEFELKTGRTHQIRVHAKYLGHPVVGDKTYGFNKNYKDLNGQLLHAYKIRFSEPTTKQELEFSVELPNYFKNFINSLTE